MTIERKPVRRGVIRSADYDRGARILEIEFDNGTVIRHGGVGDEVARRFLSSGAPASYYRDCIEDEFPALRVK